MFLDRTIAYRKSYLVSLFDRLCAELEISPGRLKLAEERYLAIAEWLSAGEHPILHGVSIYLQGSTALGTSVRPIGSLEHDVDAVSFLPGASREDPPATVKKVVGDRLRANGHYAPLLVEKTRCWRLIYANEFHIDITPAVRNALCRSGGELVPDKSLREWKETNPKGYRAAFERRSSLAPRLRTTKAFDEAARAPADVEPIPVPTPPPRLLSRIVQIAKRHRDVHFENLDRALSPISVIVTTLLSWSYERCVSTQIYDTEYDVLLDAVRRMPDLIGRRLPDGKPGWYIPNETTHGENFAERWNEEKRRADAFFAWHGKLVGDLEALAGQEGTDKVRDAMNKAFGPYAVGRAFSAIGAEIAGARASGRLFAAPTIGITTAAAATATPVRANTFYGRSP